MYMTFYYSTRYYTESPARVCRKGMYVSACYWCVSMRGAYIRFSPGGATRE